MHVVVFLSFLGAMDILRFVFKINCKYNTNYLEKNDWINTVESMLTNETVQYSKAGAISSFDKYASSDPRGKRMLFFSDFHQVSV
jgi:hypothetical protein